ncbi:MAG TPA: hypothetical protein VIX15_13970 [Streptosporangiaceae bacterium]
MSRQTGHLDTDVLAEFRAGLITGRRRRAISAHVNGCARCTAADKQLAELSALLAAISAPAMPDSVAQRLDAALAAEIAHKNEAERAVAHHSRERRRAPRPKRRPTLQLVMTRVLVPAAAVAVLAAGGYGLSLIGGQSSSSSSVTAGSAAAPAAASAVPSAAQANGLNAPSASGHVAYPSFQKSVPFGLAPEGTDFLPATLRSQLEAALRARAPAAGRTAARPAEPLGVCVLRLTSGVRPGTLKLVESAYYQGRPAIVIIASRGSGYLAWVVTPGWVVPGCSATSAGVLARTALPGISAP